MSAALERAVSDVLARGLPALSRSAVGVELGQHLQSAITAEIADGATPGAVLDALQDACGTGLLILRPLSDAVRPAAAVAG